MNALTVWWLACRPKTLAASVAPVVLGTALAFGDGIHDWPTAFACLCGALAIQIGTNLANDYFDYRHGADSADRIGPLRVTQAGLVKPGAMVCGFIIAFCIAAAISAGLFFRAGWPVAAIAGLAIPLGLLYTAGPRPLGYLGLGDILVFIFFGPVAVAGTYYVQSFEINPAVILAGCSCGFFSTAILAVNNLRDEETDRKAGKLTLAVRLGRRFAQGEYYVCIMAGALMPVAVYLETQDHLWTLLSTMVIFPAQPLLYSVFTASDGPTLNKTLAATAGLLFVFVILFSLGWML